MSRVSKLKVKQLSELKRQICDYCSNFLRIEGKVGICRERETIVYGTYCCPLFEEGKPEEADLDTIAEYYLLFKEAEEEYKKNKDLLRDILIRRVDSVELTKTYEISVRKVTANLLDTKRVREFLKKEGLLEQFTKLSEYYRLEVRKIGGIHDE